MKIDLEKLETEKNEIFLELELNMRIYGELYIKKQLIKKGYKDFKSEEELNETISKVFGGHIRGISTIFYDGIEDSNINTDIEEFIETGEIT